MHRLHMHEEILLLALKDEKGTVAAGTSYEYALGGAILAELLLSGRVRTVAVKKKQLVEVADRQPLGDPVLDECLETIATAKRRGSLETWVSRLAGTSGLKKRIAERLCERGVLRAEKDTVLLLFNRTVYPEVDPAPERELIERLRAAIFGDSAEVDPRTVVTVSLASATELLRIPFDRRELKGRKERIEALVNGDATGAAAKAAIEAAQTAALVATMVPVMVAATSS